MRERESEDIYECVDGGHGGSGLAEGGAEDRIRWKRITHCGNPLTGIAKRGL